MEATISSSPKSTDAKPRTEVPQVVSWRGSGAAQLGETLFVIEDNLHHLTALAARWLTRSWTKRLTDSGVTAGQWPVLVHLWETDGLSQRELCERIDIEEATMTRTIDGMERAGLVDRVKSPGNRSRYSIRLTPKAGGLRDRLLPGMNEMLGSATRGFSADEIAKTRSILLHLIDWSRRDCCDEDE